MNVWRSDGPCPFLTCLETGPHEHGICPDCRAVRFGNLGCATCWREHSLTCGRADCLWCGPLRPVLA